MREGKTRKSKAKKDKTEVEVERKLEKRLKRNRRAGGQWHCRSERDVKELVL